VISKKAPCLYGYDLLNVDHISRDRNYIERDDAVQGIAAIWSEQIVRDPAMLDLFYRIVFSSTGLRETMYEKQAIDNLSPKALELLAGLAVKPGQIHFTHHTKIPSDFREEFFVRLPPTSYEALERRQKFNEWINKERTAFKAEPAFQVKLRPDAAQLLKQAGIDEISVVFGYRGPCKWFKHEGHFRVNEAIFENTCILENNNTVVNFKSWSTFWQTLLFDVFPDINVDPKPFFRILAAPSCQSNVPPPAPVPTASPPAAAAATPVPPRQSRAARPPLPRKRGATGAREEEEEEEEGQVRPQQEEPPKRYKPYTGPQLYVLE
jgi:hypothetical protein